jgi:hypothetical protein
MDFAKLIVLRLYTNKFQPIHANSARINVKTAMEIPVFAYNANFKGDIKVFFWIIPAIITVQIYSLNNFRITLAFALLMDTSLIQLNFANLAPLNATLVSDPYELSASIVLSDTF